MNLADVFTILFIILGFLMTFVAYWLMAAGLFPRFVERCATRIGEKPVRTALLGAITFVPVVLIGLQGSAKAPSGPLKALAVGVALLAALAALFGSAGLALRIGEGLRSARDEQDPWRRMLRGSVVLALAFLLPFVGTFLILPFALLSGFGAFLLCRRESRRTALVTPVPTPPLDAAVGVQHQPSGPAIPPLPALP